MRHQFAAARETALLPISGIERRRALVHPRAEASVPAAIVGMCSHGLATARALAGRGVHVYALEDDPSLPGVSTSAANVLLVPSIKGEGLIPALIACAEKHGWQDTKPVLYVMNDMMVRRVAEHWEDLKPYFRLSWQESRGEVLSILNKRALADLARRASVRYPASIVVSGAAPASDLTLMRPPLIVKPAWPMGAFKAIKVDSAESAGALLRSQDPGEEFIVQEWIDGPDDGLVFAAMFLERGKILAHFEGRKLMSWPLNTGQGTVFVPEPAEDVLNASAALASCSSYTGPMAVEYKRDHEGTLWMVEPNIGRTEYCVKLCVANGVNLPFIEYCATLGRGQEPPSPRGERAWLDTDRDYFCWARAIRTHGFHRSFLRPALPFWAWEDPIPFLRHLSGRCRRLLTDMRRNFARVGFR